MITILLLVAIFFNISRSISIKTLFDQEIGYMRQLMYKRTHAKNHHCQL